MFEPPAKKIAERILLKLENVKLDKKR